MPGRHRPRPARLLGAPARVALTATAAAMAMQPLMAQGASAATTVKPKPTATLPKAMDVVPTYQGQRSCDPTAKPGLEAYVRMVLTTYRQGRSGGIVRGCGIGATSEHKEGRAFDWMVDSRKPAEKAAGDALTQWLTGKDANGVVGGNARRLGVMYVIWNRRMWSTYRSGSGWTAYSGPSTHADHVHTSFTWDGAMKRTSWWDGTATTNEDKGTCRVYDGQPAPVYTGARRVTPCSTNLPAAPKSSYSIVWPGQSGSTVKVAQAKLGVSTDGFFGASTRSKLFAWQRAVKVPVTGVLDKPTWVKLAPAASNPPPSPTPKPPAATPKPSTTTTLTAYKATVLRTGARGNAVTALQKALGITADGSFGPATLATVKAFQSAKRLPATGTVDRATWNAVEIAAYPLLAYRSTTLRTGSRGSAVVVLQRALKITPDGAFGAQTAGSVRAAQQRAKLAATGVVTSATWIAVEQAAYPLGRRLVPTATPKSAPKPPTAAETLAATTSVSAYKATTLRQGSKGAAVTALQRALGMTAVDGAFGPKTAGTVKAFQTAKKLPATGVVDRRTWDAVERAAHPLLPYRTTVLRVGSKGAAVVALQKALKIAPDGAFGAQTASAVKQAQARGKIAATGVVATLTWVTLEKLAYPVGAKRW